MGVRDDKIEKLQKEIDQIREAHDQLHADQVQMAQDSQVRESLYMYSRMKISIKK